MHILAICAVKGGRIDESAMLSWVLFLFMLFQRTSKPCQVCKLQICYTNWHGSKTADNPKMLSAEFEPLQSRNQGA